MIYKVLPVKQNCFSRLQGIKVHAGDGCFTTTVRPSCNDTVQCGYIIFQFGGKSPSAVRTVTTGESTTKFSPRPVSFTTLRRVPLHPTRFEHCPNSTEAPIRSWTPLTCIYRMYHLVWRFTGYLNYKQLFRRRPVSWINSGHVYKPRNRPKLGHVTSITADSTASRKSAILAPDYHYSILYAHYNLNPVLLSTCPVPSFTPM